MANDNGFIKLHRDYFKDPTLQNANIFFFWCWCLSKAGFEKGGHFVGMQYVELDVGQFVFGRKAASLEMKLSQRTIRTCLEHLKKCQKLTIKSTNKYSVITIIDSRACEDFNQQTDQQTDQHATSRRPARDHNIEVKRNKDKKKRAKALVDAERRHASANENEIGLGLKDDEGNPVTGEPFAELSPQKLQELWNASIDSALARSKTLSPARLKKIGTRLKDHPGRDFWEELFTKINASTFLKGGGPTGWKVDFGWIIHSEEHLLKIMSGRYDDFKARNQKRGKEDENRVAEF